MGEGKEKGGGKMRMNTEEEKPRIKKKNGSSALVVAFFISFSAFYSRPIRVHP
jgi:hypothetical protein